MNKAVCSVVKMLLQRVARRAQEVPQSNDAANSMHQEKEEVPQKQTLNDSLNDNKKLSSLFPNRGNHSTTA